MTEGTSSDKSLAADEARMLHSRFRDQIFEYWIDPELRRRGVDEHVTKAIIELVPEAKDAVVRLNDEAEVIATADFRRDAGEGEDVLLNDIDDIHKIEPVGVDPNAGWIVYATLPDGRRYIAFDFRRNKERGVQLVERAFDYLASARESLRAGRIAPCVDLLHAAYELGIKCLKGVFFDVEGILRGSHKTNAQWITNWANHGNVPPIHKSLVGKLMQLRQDARYAGGPIGIDNDELATVVDEVQLFLEHAQSQVTSSDADS